LSTITKLQKTTLISYLLGKFNLKELKKKPPGIMEYAVLSCDHTKIGPKNNENVKHV
jgi:hypothetical protein